MTEIEFGSEKIENAKIKFAQTEIDEKSNKMIAQIGFEIAGGKVITTNISELNTEKMKNILNILEIRIWEELPKKYVRIAISNSKITKIGNILNDRWIKICQ